MCGCGNKVNPQVQAQQQAANAARIEAFRRQNTGIAKAPKVNTVASMMHDGLATASYRCSNDVDCPPGMVCAGTRCVKKRTSAVLRSLR